MRAINITGKHNIDKLNALQTASYKAVRKSMTTLDELKIRHSAQIEMINRLYITDGEFEYKSLLKSELNHKIQGYKGQDIKKNLHNEETLINYEDVVIKLMREKLLCCYCAEHIFVLYKNVREPYQWTLDRLDNTLGHTKENTCISCLKCNLQRRVTDVGKFMFTKKLVLIKGGETPPDPPPWVSPPLGVSGGIG